MSLLSKKNLKETMRDLVERKAKIDEASECFDGSDGETEIMAEGDMINAVLDAFYKRMGNTARNYYGF